MEFAKVELTAVELAIKERLTDAVRELDELELVMVGGGSGSVVW